MQNQLIGRTVREALAIVENLAIIIDHLPDPCVGLEKIRVRRDAKAIEEIDFNRDDDLLRRLEARANAIAAEVRRDDRTATCVNAGLICDIRVRLVPRQKPALSLGQLDDDTCPLFTGLLLSERSVRQKKAKPANHAAGAQKPIDYCQISALGH